LESRRKRVEAIVSGLVDERSSWEPLWQECADYFQPRRIRLNSANVNKGDKRNAKILDEEGRFSSRTLQAGMMSGITSPARPWFKLTTPDPDLNEFAPVKRWLHHVTERIHWLFLRSNFYNGISTTYGDLGVFGTASLFLDDDQKDTLRVYSQPIGRFYIGNDDRMLANIWSRDISYTVRQLVHKFGDPNASPEKRWAPFSQRVKDLWDNGNFETKIDVVHLIMPNDKWDETLFDAKYKKFASLYYEIGADGYRNDIADKFLRESGYDHFPVLCPRWDLLGEDIYGTGPGADALGSNKGLQVYEKRIAQAIEKMINPPMSAPTSLRNHRVSLIPGDVTFADIREGQAGLKPLHEIRFDVEHAEAKAEQIRSRLRRAFYVDLFQMMVALDSAQRTRVTAREIDERHEEKLLMLGPVLERLNDELLDPAIDDAFTKLGSRGQLPPPPKEIQGRALRVEYISLMAQAQKLVGIGAIDRFMGFVGNVAAAQANLGVTPDVVDKVDLDQTIDEYALITGVPPQIVRSDDAVVGIRQARAQAAQQAAAVQRAEQLAGAAKNLSSTDMAGDNALTRMLGAAAPPGGVPA